MKGSPKQIEWAEKIQRNLKKGFALIEKVVMDGNKEFRNIIHENLNNDSAKFFIDNRDNQFSIINHCEASLYDAYYDERIDDEGIDEYIDVLDLVFDTEYVNLRNQGKTLDFEK